MSNLATKSKTELMAGLQRARSAITNVKAEAKNITRRGVNTGVTVGSSFAVGALRNKFGEGADKELNIPGTEIEADLALGIIASLAGISGVADEYSDVLCSAGGGILGANLAIRAFNHGADLK